MKFAPARQGTFGCGMASPRRGPDLTKGRQNYCSGSGWSGGNGAGLYLLILAQFEREALSGPSSAVSGAKGLIAGPTMAAVK